ncbi:Eco57I restriction-modification methylase domain-containing protein [Rhodopila globiformis]|uniref:site-specific DNA-methyltransferase (adenine-specific) n=1 Tax=Rhodopila globiformis TaxID=1071 RepID=A0A2S6NB42_RHOGL|nr:Eco57I restriction-modification methylase domain-containing protein [Rhodopila globiformis]PPQ31817.1 hypothetical protein CCS01_16495 [Rhodopila globiformis]
MVSLVEDDLTFECAVGRADQIRREISPNLDPTKRRELGQFLTPSGVAAFMAGMFGQFPDHIRLLDAGAGVGALTASFVHEACSRVKRPSTIDVTAFEVDPLLAVHLETTLLACADECAACGIEFYYRIMNDDYILHSSEPLLSAAPQYNCAIINPPYGKINSNSKARTALRRLGIETSNLYTAFIALAIGQLIQTGQLVAITPRSFCNGRYFSSFRKSIITQSAIRQIHVYESRKRAFADDDVLQENIIYRLVVGEPQSTTVTVTSNSGPQDADIRLREVPFPEVVQPTDIHSYIHLALSDADGALAERVRAMPCSLRDLQVSVSTGRVVDFRAREHLYMKPQRDAVPLIYAEHFDQGFIVWPRLNGRKYCALAFNAATFGLLVPRGTYVLTKRFSSKEEKRRLVSVIYDPIRVEADYVGFENHLNYFHENGQGLPATLARGLALFLNSTAVDQYFRQFSGHTQVNATDLCNLRYPTRKQLIKLGDVFQNIFPPQDEIDEAVETLLN